MRQMLPHLPSRTLLLFANSDTVRVALEAQSEGGGPVPSFKEQRFPRARASARAVRQFVGDTLAGWGVSDRRDDMRLCASEMAANAVLHGAPPGRDFSVRLTRELDEVWIEVRDSGPGRPVSWQPASEAERGRGLWLVGVLADEFEVREEVVGKTVRAGFKPAPG
ncbi:ATP-binding protein [Streptomyces vinaceus]|uniref:ATP-binding protein n=1 Tax=Streptomyces vinaceus TaxID=1960 RepID=UPI0035DFC4B0